MEAIWQASFYTHTHDCLTFDETQVILMVDNAFHTSSQIDKDEPTLCCVLLQLQTVRREVAQSFS